MNSDERPSASNAPGTSCLIKPCWIWNRPVATRSVNARKQNGCSASKEHERQEKERLLREQERERQETERLQQRARQEQEKLLQEMERLQALLRQSGIDPAQAE